MAEETVAERFNRDWAQIEDDRKVRGLDDEPAARKERLYVDPETGVSAVS